MIFFFLFIFSAFAGTLQVDILDIGQGDAILIRSPEGKVVLIDGGTGRKGDIVNTLRKKGVKSIDMMVATHAHADHIGGLDDVMEAIPVKLYLDSGLPHTTRTYEKVMDVVESKDIKYIKAKRGRKINMDDGIQLEILHPQTSLLRNTRSDLNSNSIVIRMTHGKNCFLFTGDAEEDTERQLLRQNLQECAVLKVPHHGSHHSSTNPFLRAVKPKLALISAGKNNRYGHPAPDTLKRLKNVGAKVYRTDLSGELHIESDGKRILVLNDGWSFEGDEKAVATASPDSNQDPIIPPQTKPSSETTNPTETTNPSAYTSFINKVGEYAGMNLFVFGKTDWNSAKKIAKKYQTKNKKISLNKASEEQLKTIPGIGPARARAIVEYRKSHGPFKDHQSIQNVRGIGPKLSLKIAQHTYLE